MGFVLVGLCSLSKCQVLEMAALELYKDKHGVYFALGEFHFVLMKLLSFYPDFL